MNGSCQTSKDTCGFVKECQLFSFTSPWVRCTGFCRIFATDRCTDFQIRKSMFKGNTTNLYTQRMVGKGTFTVYTTTHSGFLVCCKDSAKPCIIFIIIIYLPVQYAVYVLDKVFGLAFGGLQFGWLVESAENQTQINHRSKCWTSLIMSKLMVFCFWSMVQWVWILH